MTKTKDIFVFIEIRENQIVEGSLQLLAKSRELVNQIKSESFDVVAILAGHNIKEQADTCFKKGADKVIIIDHEKLAHYNTQHYTNAIVNLCLDQHPDSFLIPATTIGRDLAPRIAARLNTGLTADATQIEVEENSSTLLVTRPAFGGNLYGTIICPLSRPQMSTIRPNVFEQLDSDYDSKKEVIEFNYDHNEEDLVHFIKKIEKPVSKVNLDKAQVILAAGRGLKDSFDLVLKTAQEIGATPAASRALVDAGITDKSYQVGQTGTTVKPHIYIAAGISGAVQHTAGMENSDLIIAINNDPNAKIFEVADVGYIGDAKLILPLLKSELEKMLK